MRISVITPTLNEALNIPKRAQELAIQAGDWEWIVADGGSIDATIAAASAAGAHIVLAQPGRGSQLRAGVRAASGTVLVFLHADTQVPPGALAAIRSAIDRGAVGGNFRLRFDERSVPARIFEAVYYLQQNLLRTFYGDSVIFARRDVYDAIGGFADLPIMEDHEFVRALRRRGKLTCISLFVVTSARRFHGRTLQTLCRWLAILTLYNLGVPARRLARWYAPHGQKKP